MKSWRFLAGLALLATACGDGDPTAAAGSGGSGGSSNEPECYENPTTHHELINACTDAVKVEKTPALVGLNPDGSLPAP